MRDDNEQVKIELLSQWKLEAESRNFPLPTNHTSGIRALRVSWEYVRGWEGVETPEKSCHRRVRGGRPRAAGHLQHGFDQVMWQSRGMEYVDFG